MKNDIIEICKITLLRLKKMDYELQNMDSMSKNQNSKEKLIFPNKIESSGAKNVKRISEQELRQIFIEEFNTPDNELYYSIETPTVQKYSFGKSFADIKVSNIGQSALIDMSIFEKDTSNYKRIYNIEFKHANCELKSIAKDIFKLIHEKEDGAFIILLDNTDNGTLRNDKETGVFDKLYESFNAYKDQWVQINKKIFIVILSLEQGIMIWQEIDKMKLLKIYDMFYKNIRCGDIKMINNNGWDKYSIP